MTFTERSRYFSPILVRLLARDGKHGKPLTIEQIRDNSGLDELWILRLSERRDWQDVPFPVMLRFLRGCNMEFDDHQQMRRVDDYFRKSPSFAYLRKSGRWLLEYKPLLIRWRKSWGDVRPDHVLWPPLRRLLIRLNPLLKQ